MIFEQIDVGHWGQVSSQMAEIEIASISDVERRRRVTAPLPPRKDRIRLKRGIFARAAQLEQLGCQPADVLHLAAAQALQADVLLSCDDRFCRRGRRFRPKLGVRVADPVSWLKENHDAPNA